MKYSQEFYDLMHEVKVVREKLYRIQNKINTVDGYTEGKANGVYESMEFLDELIKKWEA